MDGKDERQIQELSQSYKKLGEFFGEALSDGIRGSLDGTDAAAGELSDALLENQAKIYAEIARVQEETERSQEEKLQREYQKRLSKAKTYQQAETVRQNEMFRLQKKANAEYIEELKEFLKQIETEIEAQKDKIEEAFNQIATKATKSLSELEKAKQNMADKMQDYGGIFETKHVIFRNAGPGGTPIHYDDTILDLAEKRSELENYAELLESVKALDEIPDGLFSVIRKLSVPDAIRYQEELLKMSEAERAGYVADWEAISELAEETSAWIYADETKQVLDGIEQELSEWYGTIPQGFLVEGELSAELFGQGFMSKMEALRQEIENAVLSVLPSDVSIAEAETDRQDGAKEFSSSVTYILNSAGETVAEQLRSARSHADIVKMRGGL
ncbi:MAG: hypothetical protein E7400_06705 [Ruminococcaceae bacterium]|nr:hypothetical protein [Oscillospiraceae bacterium]